MVRRFAGIAAAALVLCACSSPAVPPAATLSDPCGPPTYAEVRGDPPSYGPDELGAFPNDDAMCVGVWAPGADRWLVPQGMAIDEGTAVLAGFDGTKPARQRYCSIERIDLRTGDLIARNDPVAGAIGAAPPIICRHGGGVVVDEYGVWLAETKRLWLLDPDTLEVARGWDLVAPLRGSFAVHDGQGRVGLGRFVKRGAGQVDWIDPEQILAEAEVTVGLDDVAASDPAPSRAQGAVYADLDGKGAGVWFVRSNSACGVLVGPRGQRRGFIPGAESMSLDAEGRLWVASESGSRLYQRDDRPMTPQLARFDTTEIRAWSRPTCRV